MFVFFLSHLEFIYMNYEGNFELVLLIEKSLYFVSLGFVNYKKSNAMIQLTDI